MHNMLATLANASCDNWVELLPFVQLAHNTAYNKTLHETPHFLMFGRRATLLLVDVILGVPTRNASQSRQYYSRRTVDNLQVAYEIARSRTLQERACRKNKRSRTRTQRFRPFSQVIKCCYIARTPQRMADGANPKLISPWRGSYVVRSRVYPVLYYRVSKGDKPEEMSVYLARIKRYFAPSTRSLHQILMP